MELINPTVADPLGTGAEYQATIDSLDKTATGMVNLLNALNGDTKLSKLSSMLSRMILLLTRRLLKLPRPTPRIQLLSLLKNFDFQGLKSSVESLQDVALRQDEHLASWQDTSEIKSMMTEIYQAFKEPPSHTEGEHVAMEDDTKKPESNKAKEEPTRVVPISTVRPTTRPNAEVALIESSLLHSLIPSLKSLFLNKQL
nr:hypothetical protein [Tanacetum cinerariifolium]